MTPLVAPAAFPPFKGEHRIQQTVMHLLGTAEQLPGMVTKLLVIPIGDTASEDGNAAFEDGNTASGGRQCSFQG